MKYKDISTLPGYGRLREVSLFFRFYVKGVCARERRAAARRQPRPQGFSLKKWVGPHPFFEGKALGTRLARGENREEKGDNSFSFFVPLPSRAFSHARDRLRVSRVLLDAPRKKRDCS